MKDLQDIIALARHAGGDRAALATLVSVDGSSYRRPGASMLMTADGRRAGGISGGCLERDVERHAREVLAEGKPRLVLYDTQSEADLIVGTGLGCGGRLEILVEPIALSTEFGPVARWAGALERREALAEVIVVAEPAASGAAAAAADAEAGAEASTKAAVDVSSEPGATGRKAVVPPVGWRLFLWSHVVAEPAWHGVVAGAHAPATPALATQATGAALASAVEAAGTAAREALARGARSAPVTLDTAAGPLAAFVRVVTPPVQLIVCGAGDDAMPLVRMAGTLGWYVRVIDHRAAFATRDRFPDAAHVDVAAAGELPASLRLDARTVAVTMNHNFRADSAWLRSLAALPLPYVGVLGARSRTEKLLRDAEFDTLGAPGATGLRHVFAPAGLDIGSEGAEQIALAIIAEIQAVLAGRAGTSLRDRPGSVSQTATPQAGAPHTAAPQAAAAQIATP